MWSAIQAPLFFGLIAAFVTTLGLLLVALRGDWSARYAGLFGLAAAGMLCTMTFLHIMPEAFALTRSAPVWIAIGFFGGLVLNFSISVLFPEQPDSSLPSEAITPILAIAAHSFIDGIVYSITFAADFTSGVFAAAGLILHEFPEGVIAFAILRRHGVSNRGSFFWAFMAAAATTPLGVLISGPFMYSFSEALLGQLFALSAGLLLFVATGPLMAPLRETPPVRGLGALTAGIAIAVTLMLLPIGGHDHNHSGHVHDHTGHDFRDGHNH
ncbi:MAG: ZIP family metal transporter [Pseudomonadota bacterium]